MSNQCEQLPDQAPKGRVYTLREIRIDGFPKSLGHLRKRYITVRIDDGEVWKYSRLGIKDDALVWKEPADSKTFEALPTSTLVLTLFEAPVVGENGKEAGKCIVTILSLLDAPKGRPQALDVKKQKSQLNVMILIDVDEPTASQNSPTSEKPGELGKMFEDAQNALSKMQRSGEVPSMGTTMTAVHSASCIFNEGKAPWQPLVDKLEGFMNFVDGIAELHPYAKMAWSVVSAAYKIYKNQKDWDEKVDDLGHKIKAAYDIIMAGATLTELLKRTEHAQTEEIRRADRQHAEVLQRLSIQTVECGQFIAKYAKDQTFLLRGGKQILLNPKTIIQRLGDKFESLQQEFLQQAVASTELMTVRVLQTVQKLEMGTDLSPLRSVYVKGAGYNTQKQCLPGTRTVTLDEISHWINSTDDDTPQVCLLLGQAGTGKSTIGHTIASRFRNMERLGAAFCFSSSAAQHSRHAFATLALDLAAFDTAFEAALWSGVGRSPSDQTTDDLTRQFETFIRKPSKEVAVVSSVLILLEGLDEIGDVRARAPLLRVLSEHLRELPPGFRMLLTARPESDICALFNPSSGVMVHDLNRLANSVGLHADVRLFIRTELTKPDLGVRGLDETHYENLTARSEGLFQWARLACDYIIGDGKRGRTPRERYEDLMKPQECGLYPRDQTNVLAVLYRRLLPRLVDLEDDQARTRFKRIMGIILHTVEPLTLEAVQGLARHIQLDDGNDYVSDDVVFDILSCLGSLLSGVSDPKTPIRPLHSSFRDFLTIESRSKSMEGSKAVVNCYIGNAETHHGNIARACLRVLISELHFNICKLETSYRLNREVADLAGRVTRFISSALSYASRFWAQHVKEQSGVMIKLMSDIEKLLETKFLFWVEVLSLLGAVNTASWSLSTLIPLLPVHTTPRMDAGHGVESCHVARTSGNTLADLATDELRFVNNQANAIAESAPHIYLSALASTPATSLVHDQYGGRYPKGAQICRGRRQKWPWLHSILRGHKDRVQSVAFSSDGKRIVSGSYDKTILIWDAENGIPVGAPLKGHNSTVLCIAFSPDGKRILSGSGDNTIRLWDAENGTSVGAPMEGHTDWVCSVAFSPDGKRIVSGSYDNTMRIWDAENGTPVGAPLQGHVDWVRSVVFSPNSKRIVSGSDDNTIRIWDSENGTPVGAPLEGHTGGVRLVAFSPDGKRILSASYDKTVRILDAEDSNPVRTPLEGQTNTVESVALSSDGKRIVTGSGDNTIRTWDAENGTPVGAPLKGDTGWSKAVAFSPDGKRIVTASDDNTIRIWDSENGTPVGAPLEGHTDSVRSVEFSPDGNQIVSSSDDKTIRVWDAENRTGVGAMLEGHTDRVVSVAFLPDGKRIVSGSHDKTIRIWDAETGTPVGAPLEGHTSTVLCVAFSPDGKQILSGSGDNTIRIWDAKHSTPVGAPMEGHVDWVRSVAFSPNGKQIVSGSDDNTIRIWDAENGTPVGAPLEGHTSWVHSVAFSPDSKRIVSGSYDYTIRIWNVVNGTHVGAPLGGHTSWVHSVAFSPDGKRIVSGSNDNTIRIWDAENGSPVGTPLEGHTRTVQSVAFSPDGKRIVSGSCDNTIRIWEAENGTPIGAPLEGHTHSVWSVAFSPDGNQIVSGSNDKTIRIWDAENRTAVGALLEGDTNRVCSVAFSRDGNRIASGSDHETIQIWDAASASPVGPLLEGDTESIQSVASSPDLMRTVFADEDGTSRIFQDQTGELRETTLNAVEEKTPEGCSIPVLPRHTTSGISMHDSRRKSRPETLFSAVSFCPDVDHRLVLPYLSNGGAPPQVSSDGSTGWVMCNESDHLFWLPTEQLKYLRTPRCRLVIPTSEMVTLDMSRFVHGERWTECYQPS